MSEVVDRQADRVTAHVDLNAETVPSRTGAGSDSENLHRIVVVGGGAAGLELVTQLGDRLGRRSRAAVTLIECARTHLWKPLLHAVAAGSLDPGEYEVNYLAQAHWHGFRYHYGEMIGLDRAGKEVHLGATVDDEGRQISPARSIGYDTLVIAIGSVTNDFGTPGVAKYAVQLETPAQAERFNHRLVNACLRAQTQTEPVRPGQLHVAVVGAGATGTELAAELHRTIREVIGYGLDRIDPQRDVRIVLIEGAPRVLPGLPERISQETHRLLDKMGVEVRTGAQVTEVSLDGLTLADGSFIASELVVWAAGVKAPEVLSRTRRNSRPIASISSWLSRRCKPHVIPTYSRLAIAQPALARARRLRYRLGRRQRIRKPRTWYARSTCCCAARRCNPTPTATLARWSRLENGARSAI